MREHMKRMLLAMLCVAVFAGARSQTMGELFVAMPDSLLPAFTGNVECSNPRRYENFQIAICRSVNQQNLRG